MNFATANKCGRCNGSGKTCFDHIEEGTCFECGGVGTVDYVRTVRRFAPIVISQEIVREDLRQLYAILRDYDATARGIQLTCKGMIGTSRAMRIADRLNAAQGALRARSEAAFRALLGSDWSHVQACL